MLDIAYIRENSHLVKKAVEQKRVDIDIDELLELDTERRELISRVDNLRQQRNEAAKNRDIEKGRFVKEELERMESELKSVQDRFDHMMNFVPSIISPDVPEGKAEDENVVVENWGDKPKFDFTPKDHIQLGKDLDILDLERGAKVGGYKGYYVKNEGVMLMLGMMMYALKKVVDKGFRPMIPPTLVKEFALFGSGYFKDREYNPNVDEVYQVVGSQEEMDGSLNKDKKFLVGTAEPSLLAYYSDEVLNGKDLPLKISGFSQCYRSEIGSYGKETRGIYRVHEFMKIEQVIIAKADIEEADKLQQEMVAIAKEIHEELGLPYQIIIYCTGALTIGKYKQYDIEAWMPGLDKYGETGSASNFLDWQSRRLNVKYEEDGKKQNVIMLNNTVLPSPRPFIAILENYQQADGSVKVPEVLVPYTGFSVISPKR